MDLSKWTNLGFDLGWLESFVLNHGQEALQVLQDLVSHGFSITWIQELVAFAGHLFQPVALTTLLACRVPDKKMMASAIVPGDVVDNVAPAATGSGFLDFFQNLLTTWIGKMASPAEMALIKDLINLIQERITPKAAVLGG